MGYQYRLIKNIGYDYERNKTGQIDMGKGVPKTTPEMTQQSTSELEWDFDSIWGIDEGSSYPYLYNGKKQE